MICTHAARCAPTSISASRDASSWLPAVISTTIAAELASATVHLLKQSSVASRKDNRGRIFGLPASGVLARRTTVYFFILFFLLRRAGERRDVAAEEGVVEFARAVEVALVDEDERAGRGRREQRRERVGAARLDGHPYLVLLEDVGHHLGLGRRADVVQRDEARLAVVVQGVLGRQPLDQVRAVVGTARHPLLVLRLANRTEHPEAPRD